MNRISCVIVRQEFSAQLAQARFWASSDLEADPQTLLAAKSSTASAAWCLTCCITNSSQAFHLTLCTNFSPLEAAQPKTANIEFYTTSESFYIYSEVWEGRKDLENRSFIIDDSIISCKL
jgi:hypothetical protein